LDRGRKSTSGRMGFIEKKNRQEKKGREKEQSSQWTAHARFVGDSQGIKAKGCGGTREGEEKATSMEDWIVEVYSKETKKGTWTKKTNNKKNRRQNGYLGGKSVYFRKSV